VSAISSPTEAATGNDACLHQLMSSTADVVRDCLQYTAPGDSILLLDTAVVLLLDPGWMRDLPSGVSVFASRPDADARALAGGMQCDCLDDKEWAALVCRHAHCLSWK